MVSGKGGLALEGGCVNSTVENGQGWGAVKIPQWKMDWGLHDT